MSSCLQLSSPKPVMNTSSQEIAFCASGEAASFAAASLATELVEVVVAPLAALDAPESEALTLLTCAGTPVAWPPSKAKGSTVCCKPAATCST